MWLRYPLSLIPAVMGRRCREESLRTAAGGLLDAGRGLGWVWRERRRLPNEVVAELVAVARAERAEATGVGAGAGPPSAGPASPPATPGGSFGPTSGTGTAVRRSA
jgi:hypothetical protein